MTTCKVCGKNETEAEFYSSITTHCKEHWRERVRQNRSENADYYREFDRNRANLPHRVDARYKYQKTEAYKESHAKSMSRYRNSHPDRYKARNAVGNAVRDGKLIRLPCFVCGEKAHAHHPDYSRPLDVVWLCQKHHKEAHALVSLCAA